MCDVHSGRVDLVHSDCLEIGQDDEIGAPAGGDQSKVHAAQTIGSVVGGEAQRAHRRHAVTDEPPEEVVDSALGEQSQGEEVVGTGDYVGRQLR